MNRIKIFTLSIIFLTVSLFSQVMNPDKPLKGNWDFQMKKIWEVENAGKDVFGEFRNIVTARDGRVYIADSKSLKIFIFSKDGKFISSFGEQGGGPGEIMSYSTGRLFSVNDTIIFFEVRKIQYFTLDGGYKKSVMIPPHLYPRAFISEDVFCSAPVTTKRDPGKGAKITLYNIKDKSEKIISEFSTYENASRKQKLVGQGSVTVVIEAPNVMPLMMIAYGNGKLVYGISDSYMIDIFDIDSKKNIGFAVGGRKREKVSENFKEELNAALKPLPQDMAKNIIDGLPEQGTFFVDIKSDKNGLIYVFVSAPDETNVQAVDIFSPEGKYLYSSTFKVEEELSIKNDVFYLSDDFLILVTEDDEGNLKVGKYSIQLPVL